MDNSRLALLESQLPSGPRSPGVRPGRCAPGLPMWPLARPCTMPKPAASIPHPAGAALREASRGTLRARLSALVRQESSPPAFGRRFAAQAGAGGLVGAYEGDLAAVHTIHSPQPPTTGGLPLRARKLSGGGAAGVRRWSVWAGVTWVMSAPSGATARRRGQRPQATTVRRRRRGATTAAVMIRVCSMGPLLHHPHVVFHARVYGQLVDSLGDFDRMFNPG